MIALLAAAAAALLLGRRIDRATATPEQRAHRELVAAQADQLRAARRRGERW